MEGIKAVAFDIDGTLYASWKLFLRKMPFFVSHGIFYLHYGIVRKNLRRTAPLPDFYEYQARLMAERLHTDVENARQKVQKICYDGLKSSFDHIKPYPDACECIKAFKDAGLKIGMLSDFPPDQKGSIWGLRELCDVCIGAEESGALKPSKYAFGTLALKLGVKPEEILYVGNSYKYDILGAHHAGMKTAFLMRGFRKIFNIKAKDADISFKNYRQLREIVLK